MTEFDATTKPASEVNMEEVTFWNPDADTIDQQVVVTINIKRGEHTQQLRCLCQLVDRGRVLLDMETNDVISLENSPTTLKDYKIGVDLVTPEYVAFTRALVNYEETAIRLGLLNPTLTDAQIRNLPIDVRIELASVILSRPRVQDLLDADEKEPEDAS